jgi:hypothetical protein
MAANVIYRGPIAQEPETINLPVAGAYLPGIFVTSDGGALTQAVAADATGRIFVLGNRRFYGQGPDEAYPDGDTGVAYELEPGHKYSVQFAAGTYSPGDELTIDANGRLAAAGLDAAVVATYDDAGATLTAGDRADVVIAFRSRTAPA